jgi:Family of unknown function (DUF6125)
VVDENSFEITELSRDELLGLAGIFLGDVLSHYGMWFTETVHSQGVEKAVELEHRVLLNYFPLVLRRLAPHFGIEIKGDIPSTLDKKSREELVLLIQDIAKTWVTGDGLWFQAVESSTGMDAAKLINDTCWSHFARMEAYKILQYLKISHGGGLNALRKALRLRIYSTINGHRTAWDDDGSLIFTMEECRVQGSRRRKKMEDYPCKSAGQVEYSQFAIGIDPRIKTDCVCCPPDPTPKEEFCSWRFTI